MEILQSINLISINPAVRNGRPCIAGTTIEVTAIVVATIVHQQSPDEIASAYKLSLAQVYASLAYYYEHKVEMDTFLHERRKLAAVLKVQQVGR